MTPQRPYLLRAIYEWILDNGEIPYILIDPFIDGVLVPSSAISNDKVVLNISPVAVPNLDLGMEAVVFSCRFNGVERDVYLPIKSIRFILESLVGGWSLMMLNILLMVRNLARKR